jgi:hypothetical protein
VKDRHARAVAFFALGLALSNFKDPTQYTAGLAGLCFGVALAYEALAWYHRLRDKDTDT